MTTIIRLPEVLARTGLSRSTVYNLVNQGAFPKQLQLGARSSGWVEEEIEHWLQARIAMRQPQHKAA